MELPWFWIWLVLAAALYIGEMLTVTFFLLPFAIGATVSFVSVLFGADIWLQWTLFALVSVICLIAVRPLFKRLTHKSSPAKVGVDRLIGMTGVVIEGAAPAGEMRARVAREVWNVASTNGDVYPIGSQIKVLQVEGVHLIVKAI